jgi:uncharacterized membrane protein
MIRPKRGLPTKPERLVAFSDGVFAVAITLLALDLARIKAEPSTGVTIFDSLAQQWPTLLAFAGAFAFIGVAWLNHHRVFSHVKAVSRAVSGANLLLLAGVALVPWVTGALAEGLGDPEGDRGTQEIVLYGAVTGIGALTWALLYHVLAQDPDLLIDPTHARHFAADRAASSIGITGTIAASALGYFWSPLAATVIFLALPVFYAIGSDGFERTPRQPQPSQDAS